MGTQMTVVRLADGSLWLHSPVKLDDSLTRAFDSVGRVAFLAMTVRERRHEIAVMHAIVFTRGSTVWRVLVEGVVRTRSANRRLRSRFRDTIPADAPLRYESRSNSTPR